MIMTGTLVILINVIGVTLSANILSVPEDVMSFIMGCDGRFTGIDGPKIPVTRTEIDSASGMENKQTSMMNIAELRQSLMDTVDSDDVVSQILAQVEESLEGRQVVENRSAQCTNIKIDVPPQEVKGLNEQLQAIVQQNNYQLLEQVNTLFSFKLNSFYKEFEEMLEKKLAELGAGLIQFQQAQAAASAQKVTEVTDSQPESSIGETRIFSSNTPMQAFPAISPGIVVKDAAPIPQDYDLNDSSRLEKISPSVPQDYPDYPEENEVAMEKADEMLVDLDTIVLEKEEFVQTTQQPTPKLTTPATSTTTSPTTTTTTTTTTLESSTTESTTATTTTTTTSPSPSSEEPETEVPIETVRSPFRRRRPGILPNPRRPGIRRPITSPVDEPEEQEVPLGSEIAAEDSKSEVDVNQSSVQSRRSRLEEMKKKRKALLDRLRG